MIPTFSPRKEMAIRLWGTAVINTVVAAVITSNLFLADAPGNVRIPARATGLKKASVVNVSQIITVDKSYLTERVGTLKANYMKDVDDGLRLALAV
jgi:mRNA interferase MazF